MSIEFIFDCFIYTTLILPFLLLGYYKWVYEYWQRRKLPHLKSQSFFGNLANSLNYVDNFGTETKNVYNEMKQKKWKHGGVYIFASPTYVVIDPKYIENVMTHDFQYFADTGHYHNNRNNLELGLFSLSGSKWQRLRRKYVSIFTPEKTRMIFQKIIDLKPTFLAKIKEKRNDQEAINANIIKYAISDLVGSCLLGSDYEVLKKESVFQKYVKSLYDANKLHALKRHFGRFNPVLANILNIKLMPQEVSDIFKTTLTRIINNREMHSDKTQDYFQMFIDMKNKMNKTTIEEILQQSSIFFSAVGAGGGTRSFTFSLYEIAKNQEIQNKLRRELKTILTETQDEISYDVIQKMKYLKQIIYETLRKYPSQPTLFRKCVQDYKVPDADVVIEKGTNVLIPLYGLHHDEEYYPDPEKFDPDRFDEETKTNYFMPFGQGPRSCFGMRLGMLIMQFCLASLVMKYKFTLNEKTKNPLELLASDSYIKAAGGIWFDIEEI